MTAASGRAAFERLGAFLGIQRSYRDANHVLRRASTDATAAAVEALLGEPVPDPVHVLARLQKERHARVLNPAAAVWLPGTGVVRLNAAALGDASLDCVLEHPGGTSEWRVQSRTLDTVPGGAALLLLPPLDPGYHTLHLTARYPGRRADRASALIIAAPRRAFKGPDARSWGIFLPLYALHSSRSWGIGDYGDLEALACWAHGLGAREVGVLPLLAAFLDDAVFDPSPYAPASRLMWNELYIDIERLPELQSSAAARALIASPAFQDEIRALRSAQLLDYHRLAKLKSSALRELSAGVSGARRREFRAFLKARPEVQDYARFRAQTERNGPFDAWPEASGSDFDPDVASYHAYAQWAADTQIAAVAAQRDGAGLYLDLPLGVHAAGYDVWRWPGSFARGLNTGAPPDPLALGGQDWDFPPPHPTGIREQRYEYVIAYLRHSLRYASRLRIDHVMGLHHLFVIPRGFEARDGVYVRYPADELYAILCLESHLHRTEVVGENLGTVPSYVNSALRRRGISGTYVVPFEVRPEAEPPLRPPRPGEAAALNTHDLLPFAAWWSESGWAHLPLQRLLGGEGLLEPGDPSPAAVRDALLVHLGRSEARLVIAALEDLWLETLRQNVPGFNDEPNWRRKARYSLEALQAQPEVRRALEALNAARRRPPPARS